MSHRLAFAAAVVMAGVLSLPAPAAAADPTVSFPRRPRLEVAVGMGASLDDAGLSAAGLSPVPAFLAMGGFGEGMLGGEVGVFSNNATGRYRPPNVPVDRLAFDGMVAIRPAADALAGDDRYQMRVLRTVAFDLGFGYERDSRITARPEEVNRFGVRIGGHVDLPLTPAGLSNQLRVRLAVRRLIGIWQEAFPDGETAPDSRVEIFAALATVF
jgi:hypothetical protein